MQRDPYQKLYEVSSRLLLWPLRISLLRRVLTWFAKVWLRQARVMEHLSAGSYDAIVDGGASIGEFAAIARLACPRIPLLCVEPHPPSAAVLRRRGFTVIEAALWDRRGTTRLMQPTAAVTSCTVAAVTVQPDRPSWDVQTVRLEDLPISGQNVLIKLDLQGAELSALAGMGDLWGRCGGLLLEVSYGPQGTYEAIRALLSERGFDEAATFNELEGAASPIEADKLWLRRRRLNDPTRDSPQDSVTQA